MPPSICIGCRAIELARPTASDMFPYLCPPGMKWEVFTCARCGVQDVRLVLDTTLSA